MSVIRWNLLNIPLQISKKQFVFPKDLEEKLEKEISHVDQKLVLELDQLVSDQQATLQVSLILYTTFVSCKQNKIDLLLCKYNLRSSDSILLSMQAV